MRITKQVLRIAFVIDDLYQSGASIWCFAEYLKECCDARTVIAITPVKALKDGGNK